MPEKIITFNNLEVFKEEVVTKINTAYSSLSPEEGGSDVSLVTTGDKYNWDNKLSSITAGTGIDVNGSTVKATGVEYKNNTTVQQNALKFVKLTQAEYDSLVQAGTVDSDTFYIIYSAQ